MTYRQVTIETFMLNHSCSLRQRKYRKYWEGWTTKWVKSNDGIYWTECIQLAHSLKPKKIYVSVMNDVCLTHTGGIIEVEFGFFGFSTFCTLPHKWKRKSWWQTFTGPKTPVRTNGSKICTQVCPIPQQVLFSKAIFPQTGCCPGADAQDYWTHNTL